MTGLPHARRRQRGGGEQRVGQRVGESVTGKGPFRTQLGGAGTAYRVVGHGLLPVM
ncbi:hypothetical protein ACWDFH_25735 [Streptomyces kronopolitis]